MSYIQQHPIYPIASTWQLNFPDQAKIDVLEVTDLQYSYRISSIFRMPIEDIDSYVGQSPHVWTHSPVCARTPQLLPLFDKKVYIIRDPRDRALSAARYYCSDYMLKYFPQEEKDPGRFLDKNFEYLMHEWVWHVFDYLRLTKAFDIHVTFFEGLLLDFQVELERLLNYLETPLSDQQKSQLEEAVSFKILKRKNPKHLKKGQAGYWMDQLSDEHFEKAEIIAGPLMRFLGYPSERDGDMHFSHEMELYALNDLKQEILRSQKQLYASIHYQTPN
ncbi:hypothetical protein C900_02630 [Fulvivirga imtechensis AK7]|uniref:Sulfotransferase domain-containing protein n=2 Tax=Fulvivirga TaxID=396811 RepID=L8JXN2_9BACT|nr:hypothetical protein C900_02630 [Fulvivirga imtechensis AK7]